MARWDALELLDHLLDGGSLDAEPIDQILGEVIPEGVHLEYKGWQFIQKDKKAKKGDAAEQLRRYVAGFANSDGGVLLIGFAEQRDADGRAVAVTLDGDPTSKEAADPRALCSRTLTDIAHMLMPPPRMRVATHGGRPIVAVRSPARRTSCGPSRTGAQPSSCSLKIKR